jgi:hypothetical protein
MPIKFLRDNQGNFAISNGKLVFLQLPWTPEVIDTQVWLDATDASTITEAGGNVSQWDDKSGNGNNFIQNNGAKQFETGVRTLNGLNVLDINGTDVMQRNNISGRGSDFLCIGVWDVDSGITLVSQSGAPQSWNALVDALNLQADGTVSYSGGSIVGLGGTITCFDFSLMGAQAEAFINGTSEAVEAEALAVGNGTARIAANFVGGSGINGSVGELLWTNDRSLDTRQKLEGYLAWKWGLEANLPLDHPYKDAAP